MKKWMAACLALVMVCTFAGCKKERATEHKDGMVGAKSTREISDVLEITFTEENREKNEVSFQIHNPHENLYVYGYGHVMEVLIDGVWYTTQYGAPDAPAGEINIQPGETKVETYTLFNDPPVGTYRIVVMEAASYDDRFVKSGNACIAAEFMLE